MGDRIIPSRAIKELSINIGKKGNVEGFMDLGGGILLQEGITWMFKKL